MKKLEIILCIVGISLLVGLIVWMMQPATAAIVVSVSAVVFTIVQRLLATPSNNVVVRRLYRQQLIGGLFLIFTGALMCNQVWMLTTWFHHNEWMVALAIACVLQCYSAFRLPYALKSSGHKD